MKTKIFKELLVGCLLLLMTGAANASIINLNAVTATSNSPVTVGLTAGSYEITPIGIDDGGLYTAWDAWSHQDKYLNKYTFSSNEFGTQTVGQDIAYDTAAQALANALSASFTLAADGTVNFYFLDNYYLDNTGGMSLNLEPAAGAPVPEPSTILLLGCGLLGLAGAARKKTGA